MDTGTREGRESPRRIRAQEDSLCILYTLPPHSRNVALRSPSRPFEALRGDSSSAGPVRRISRCDIAIGAYESLQFVNGE